MIGSLLGRSYKQLRFFRRFFADFIRPALRVYPEARLKIEEKGVTLLPSRPHVPRDALGTVR